MNKIERTIWKFPLSPEGVLHDVPEGTKFLSVQMQQQTAMVWGFCDPKSPKRNVHLNVYGTGFELPEDPGRFLGTFQIDALVFHVFDPSDVDPRR